MPEFRSLEDKAETYLKALISEVANLQIGNIGSFDPFGELGIDSFFVLKIVKALENDFGSLPKTLLFENFHVNDLAGYFVDNHHDTLAKLVDHKLMDVTSEPTVSTNEAPASGSSVPAVAEAGFKGDIPRSEISVDLRDGGSPEPVLMLETDAYQDPVVSKILNSIFQQYKNESSISRGTRTIAPNIFLDSERIGFFNYARTGSIILGYAYTGPEDQYKRIVSEFENHCQNNSLQLSFFTHEQVSEIGATAYSATPFGVTQRVENLQEFTLKGSRMRRLRYQVSKFEKNGQCHTTEYTPGDEPRTDSEIAGVIDAWCASRAMVNPLIHVVKREIQQGTLDRRHRVFLTRLNDQLQNVILISPIINGYLMDLEFYGEDMPLGGLEYSISEIIKVLVAEGCEILSLGGTYGCKLVDSSNADEGVSKVLDDLRAQKIFNDEGNLQFKNKFRTQNLTIYLCRRADSVDPGNVLDIIMMIADPEKMQCDDAENHTGNGSSISPQIASDDASERDLTGNETSVPEASGRSVPAPANETGSGSIVMSNVSATPIPDSRTGIEPRSESANDRDAEGFDYSAFKNREEILEKADYNVQLIADADVECDLKTDSWAQLDLPVISERMRFLRSRLQNAPDLDSCLAALFPHEHCIITESGRSAEKLYWSSQNQTGVVLQNILFPTGIFNQIDNGFNPLEIPDATVFDIDDSHDDEKNLSRRANLSIDALNQELATGKVTHVCMELLNNASGGYPVAVEHLNQISQILSGSGIPLVLDITRIVENCVLLIEMKFGREAVTEDAIWSMATDIMSCGDVLIGSLAKDFCLDMGGIVCVRDAELLARLDVTVTQHGGTLDMVDRKVVALSLSNKSYITGQVLSRTENTRRVWSALSELAVPVVNPAGGHCVLLRPDAMPQFSGLPSAATSFSAWLFMLTGLRTGDHSVGLQKNGALNGLVRLAVPLGLDTKDISTIISKLQTAFRNVVHVPVLKLDRSGSKQQIGPARKYILQGIRDRLTTDQTPLAVPNTPIESNSSSDSAQKPHYAAEEHRKSDNPVAAEPVSSVDEQLSKNSQGKGSDLEPVESSSLPELVSGGMPAQDIAVVGMAGRYPKSDNLAQFWSNLLNATDCITQIDDERFAKRRQHRKTPKYRAGFISDIDRFDSLFFNISPREAETLDPQERHFLEVAWECLEDAGYYPDTLTDGGKDRAVGVYVGTVWSTYQSIGAEERLLGQPVVTNSFQWSIANRVSYCLNLTGPSMAVDTACSASLTALYLACEGIKKGDCKSAIVGGVNLDVHAGKQDVTVAGGLLAEDGLCRTFGANGDGYVPGEGVGALLLKPLAAAVADNDQVYGVIKAAAINHGGRTSGFSVPNPKAQAALIGTALEDAQFDARTIGYVEAHGTGTELGDPIEISGLKNAFEGYAVQQGSCAVGSVKTNIGHLEAAAGIVGISKVLLQMKHKTLVPSLHSSELNEHIDFENSPFTVQQECTEWVGKTVDNVQYPLRAGVSSFGAGGSNAHIILEQYDTPVHAGTEVPESRGPHYFPLSARSAKELADVVTRMRAYLDSTACSAQAISTGLRTGRKPFDHRVVFVAASIEALAARLDTYLDDGIEGIAGQVSEAASITSLLSSEEKDEFVKLVTNSGDHTRIAQLWVSGVINEFPAQPYDADCIKISLPTYPFADKRHWITPFVEIAGAGVSQDQAFEHPMIDGNESTFAKQIFRKTFTDEEFYIFDHLVSGIPTLPGVAYLDYARKAGELAANMPVRSIKNIVWISPIVVEDSRPTKTYIELTPADGAVQFEVYSDDAELGRRPHSQGKLTFDDPDTIRQVPEPIDIQGILQPEYKIAAGAQAYPVFSSLGLDLGSSFQALKEVYQNEKVVVGVLELPEHIDDTLEQFVLHPSLVDSAFQAAMAAQVMGTDAEMFVPYSLGEVEIYHPLTRRCFSYVEQTAPEGSKVSKADVHIIDESGKVLVRITDSVGVPLTSVHEKPSEAESTDADGGFSELYYATEWRATPLQVNAEPIAEDILFVADSATVVESYKSKYPPAKGSSIISVVHGNNYVQHHQDAYEIDTANPTDYAKLAEALKSAGKSIKKYVYCAPGSKADESGANLQEQIDAGVLKLVEFFRWQSESKPKNKVQLLYVYSKGNGIAQALNAAVNGLVTILQAESPKLICSTIEFDQLDQTNASVIDGLHRELQNPGKKAAAIRYNNLERDVRSIVNRTLESLQSTATDAELSLKENGVYVITGGMGGLGLLFAEYLARTCRASLVLSGRSTLSDQKNAALENMRSAGSEVLYVQADIASQEDVVDLLEEARSRFGRIDGIIHSAGVVRDSYIKNKTRDEMNDVFGAKIKGTVYLDQASQADDLDFFVTFSSLAALAGNAGQSDYSYANHFMDTYMGEREKLQKANLRSGRSLSINWSIWADGGMQLDEQTEIFFRNNLGILPLRKEFGLDTFVKGLLWNTNQIAVIEGVQEKIESAWGVNKPWEPDLAQSSREGGSAEEPATSSESEEGSGAAELVRDKLSSIVMDFLKLDEEDLDLDAILLDLGFDSIGLTTFANTVNQTYELDITPVLFFEYPSIREISKHFVAEYPDKVSQVHGGVQSDSPQLDTGIDATQDSDTLGTSTQSDAIGVQPFQTSKSADWQRTHAGVVTDAASIQVDLRSVNRFQAEPMAIVGMSGVMPQSDNVNEYWEKLFNAENNMITVIPEDRWNWEDYQGDPIKEKNKTNSKWGGFMRNVDTFDPFFFGISPREAEMMDPQQRIFLETVWKTVEDAGHRVSDLAGSRTGLFVGAATNDYTDSMNTLGVSLDGYTASGNSHAVLANRVSFMLGLRGPSAPIDTACSSSLIAVHRAIESIHTGSCDMAIVGGIQVMLTPAAYISFGMAGMLSDEGKCKTFDKDADGYVRGEGSGAILIKPLSRAKEDRDNIYAVIKSTAENHGGRVTALTAPNPSAQAELLVEAYDKAQIDPASVGYIECHGTGTSLGDPIEIQGMKKAFSELYKKCGNKKSPLNIVV